MSKGIGADKLERILSKFPELSKQWLLYGEGDMLVSSNTPANYGNDTVTTRQQEDGITSAPASTIDMLLAELKAQRESSDNQISRLLAIIENMTNKQK